VGCGQAVGKGTIPSGKEQLIMQSMTGVERIGNILQHKPVDRIGLYEHFWSDTQKVWTEQGHIQEGEDLSDHFGFDMDLCWAFNLVADLDVVPQVIEETEETILTMGMARYCGGTSCTPLRRSMSIFW
jgi:hypothetical protein